MGTYFELGAHDSEDAYIHVRHYIDNVLKSNRQVSKQDGKPMPLVNCLDIFASDKYSLIIRRQDRYLGQ